MAHGRDDDDLPAREADVAAIRLRWHERLGRWSALRVVPLPLLICARCAHGEDMHPRHGPCRFHLCDCPGFASTQHQDPRHA